ncbi:MAG: hypothetical protein IJ955_05465, partial [Oscillospiraceae bacterium]|nr:hypothetical protein [Oscillospiraceae bacterium]
AAVSRTCDLAQPVITVKLNSSDQPVITWEKVAGADKYEVYRATSKSGTYSKLYTTTGTKFTNTSVTAGTTYYYKVKAICSANSGGNSAFSAVKSITTPVALTAPTGVTASNNASTGKPVVKWNKVSGAEKYEVYRAMSGDSTYELLATVTGTKLTNSSVSAGEVCYYKVRAVAGNKKSVFSSEVSCMGKLAQPVVSVQNLSGKSIITWDEVPEAATYYIYYAERVNAEYTMLGSINNTSLERNTSQYPEGTVIYYKVVAVLHPMISDANSMPSDPVPVTAVR